MTMQNIVRHIALLRYIMSILLIFTPDKDTVDGAISDLDRCELID
ncbi:hypothetical protein [Chamaesiphon sp. VAR_48_metabat_403]|nr:hypothetical protein [Chamaesiphon sp. VAR_48_metabat_403]